MSAQALLAAARRGDLDATSLVWRSGLPDWQSFGSVLGELGELGIAPIATDPPVRGPTAAGFAASPAPRDDVIYAGFLRRWVALLIDTLIIGVPVVALYSLFVLLLPGSAGADDAAGPFAYLLWLLAAPLYFAGMECSAKQATFGKQAMGIKVTDLDGRRLGVGRALGRWAAAALSHATLYLGFLMAGFTERKQALHDLIAGTLVVDRQAFTDEPARQHRGRRGSVIALLVVLAIAVPAIGLLAAIALPSYQDYTLRAKVMSALAQARSLQVAVTESTMTTGHCPHNRDDDFREPAGYANGTVAAIVLDADENGRCRIDVQLAAPEAAIDGHHLRLTMTVATPGAMPQWECRTDLPARLSGSGCTSGLRPAHVAP